MRPILRFAKKHLLTATLAALFVALFALDAHAQTLNTGLRFGAQIGLGNQDIRVTIAKIIRIILGFLGIIAVGLTMYAGFLWMTAKGNEEQIDKAKGFLKNAIIGLAIILSSFAIVSFILSRLLLATGGAGNGNNNNNGNGGAGGLNGLGNGIVKSVYPEPFQKNVAPNTSIIVTFREPMRASSICQTVVNDKCAPGAKMDIASIKIFRTAIGDGPDNIKDATVTSTDNKTFIFKPAPSNYLGVPNEFLNYTVNLTRNILKANGDRAFNLTDFRWTFDAGGELDFKAPQIVAANKGGIFPPTDDEADTVSGSQPAVAATGTVTVSAQPLDAQAASAALARTAPAGVPVRASIEGTNACDSQNIVFSIVTVANSLKARVAYGDPRLVSGDLPIANSRFNLGPCGLTVVFSQVPAAGEAWRLTVAKARSADTLNAGLKTYRFVSGTPAANEIRIGSTLDETAANIASVINNDQNPNPDLKATVNKTVVTMKARVAGSSGSNIELSAAGNGLLVSRMSGGSDLSQTFSVKGKRDQPKNTVIQINFDEAVNPAAVSGKSSDVAEKIQIINADSKAAKNGEACAEDSDCLSYKCVQQSGANKACQGNQLAGSFQVSNQYKTVEFISDNKCGINGCGESIYCLPANAHLRVETSAASLQSCARDADCASPFTACVSGVCRDNLKKQNLPTASAIDGVVDMADNSLDGNRNTDAQGKANTYNENLSDTDNAGKGDNHAWSFWTNDRLDLTPPRITLPTLVNNASGVPLSGFFKIPFSKLMMSSSLSTGTVTVNNGIKDITHKLINLWSLSNSPIGYWIRKEDGETGTPDGQADFTSAFVYHGIFTDSTVYRSQVGSGVKDIYQNCFKPSASAACGATADKPSCCRQSNPPYGLVPTGAQLTPEGNCPTNL